MPMLIFKILVLVGLIATQIAESRIDKREKMPVTVSASEKQKPETPDEIFVNRVSREEQRERLIRKGIMYRGADGKLHRVTG